MFGRASRQIAPAAARRATVWLFVAALVFAPALAAVWPALGKGPMLYVGEAAATADEVGHAGHGDHAHHADVRTHDGHAFDADPVAQADAACDDHPATAAEVPAAELTPHTDHARHCALCVLVSLAWAPLVHVDTSTHPVQANRRPTPGDETPPPVQVAWSGGHARAPPALS